MSLDAMKQALAVLEEVADEVFSPYYNKLGNAILALRAAIEQAQDPETELETYKRLYELRGKALERPCSNCGHQPAKIKAMAQPEQEPVAWMHNLIEGNVITHRPADIDRHPERWAALYTAPPPCPTCEALARSVMMDQTSHDMAPRQWQGLTDEDVDDIERWIEFKEDGSGRIPNQKLVRYIERKLKEKNA